jgi:hydroxylamine reductase (hybrid-cluster protein)
MAEAFLKKDILCISEGEASVCLAKYGYLTPGEEKECGEGVKGLLGSLGDNVPAVIDCNAVDFMVSLAGIENKALSEYPIAACFAEANRSAEVAKAMAFVSMGVSTYFWPCLPVTGSPKTMRALTDLCVKTFGGQLHVVTARIDAPAKAELFIKAITSPPSMSGKSWVQPALMWKNLHSNHSNLL